jgi:hypothetical protein
MQCSDRVGGRWWRERKVALCQCSENLTKGAAEREACPQPDLTGWKGLVGKCELVADLRQLARVWDSNADLITILPTVVRCLGTGPNRVWIRLGGVCFGGVKISRLAGSGVAGVPTP